jgi:spore coat polysaccharide biosynthesis protein SpsF (cytidylyltransferase family)
MNSERLPGKALLEIGGRTIIEHVIKSCFAAASFITRRSEYMAYCETRLLVPKDDDELIAHMKDKIEIITGPENDVITRYIKAANSFRADYVVRITGDCLYIPAHNISRHIKRALKTKADYTNNILERVHPEGWDTEVLSKRLLDYLDMRSTSGHDREHVTTLIRRELDNEEFPKHFKVHNAKDQIDFSHVKTSIDTLEDYQRALADFKKRELARERTERYGKVF